MTMLPIVMKRKYKNLNAGERVAFREDEARALIAAGAAVEDHEAHRARTAAAAADASAAREMPGRVTKPATASVTKD